MRNHLSAAAILLVAATPLGPLTTPVLAADPIDVTFSSIGSEQIWAVPQGVTSIHVVLVGGHGGAAAEPTLGSGGSGARVVGDMDVTGVTTLYVEVGGNGGSWNQGGQGGFNGGGSRGGTDATGGGGAADVRTVGRADGGTLGSRLMVAGGGGGAGTTGNGGNAGEAGQSQSAGGGGAGTQSSGGAGGAGNPNGGTATAGGNGALGVAGDGGFGDYESGGGGGGGYYGGGGGGGAGQHFDDQGCFCWIGSSPGGGGGGSSYTGDAANVSVTLDTSQTPSITITYTPSSGGGGGTGSDAGTVEVQFSVQQTAACIELSTSSVDFGSVALGQEQAAGHPDITITNCGTGIEDVLARGSDATATGATWSLVGGNATCDDTLGTDRYRLQLEATSSTLGLTTSNQQLESLDGGGTGTHTARLYAACPGSSGAGSLMTTQIVFTATAGG